MSGLPDIAWRRPISRRRAPARPILAALLCAIVLVSCGGIAGLQAAVELPHLTGRVVDDAGALSAASQTAIESKLKTLEDRSGIQFEVATIPTLGGEEIEPFANRLFRAWKLGEKTKNNGVLLLVVPPERKVRIEVGYGLEGTLTDAISKLIITNAMIPRFKAGDIQGGIERATDDIISVLSTDAADWKKRPDLQARQPEDSGDLPWWAIMLFIGIVLLVFYMQRRSRRGGMILVPPIGGTSTWGPGTGGSLSEGGSSSGDSDNGFSGGGGSSGGGGASGQW